MRVRIYNEVFDRGLTPSEAKIYVYLIVCANRLNNAVVKIDTIRAACSISSRSTVSTAIQGLCSKGLINKYRRRSHDGDYIANGYNINQLRGGWFFFDTSNMNLFQLDKSDFYVYLFFMKCKRHNSRKVFPSLRRTAAALRLCLNTVITAIKNLLRLLLIRKSRPSSQGRLNVYIILGLNLIYATDSSVAVSDTVPSFLMLSSFFVFVKRLGRVINSILDRIALFLRSGSSFFVQQYLDPSKDYSTKRNN